MSRASEGILEARPRRIAAPAEGRAGADALGLGAGRDGVLVVPRSLAAGPPAPLLLLLHGAGGRGRDMVGPFAASAEARGLLLLAPDARGRTWDVILGRIGPDVAFLDRALDQVFARHAVDPERIAVAGFSDGASYALTLGLANGGLFGHVLAFSPGFMAPPRVEGRPRLFVSHGVHDEVLPIDRCSRRLAPMLRRAGYDLDYREFDGGHAVPEAMVAAALDRFLA